MGRVRKWLRDCGREFNHLQLLSDLEPENIYSESQGGLCWRCNTLCRAGLSVNQSGSSHGASLVTDWSVGQNSNNAVFFFVKSNFLFKYSFLVDSKCLDSEVRGEIKAEDKIVPLLIFTFFHPDISHRCWFSTLNHVRTCFICPCPRSHSDTVEEWWFFGFFPIGG